MVNKKTVETVLHTKKWVLVIHFSFLSICLNRQTAKKYMRDIKKKEGGSGVK